MRVVGGSQARSASGEPQAATDSPRQKRYKGLTARSFNKHNTMDPCTNLLLCSLFGRFKRNMV
jgi:hypothetical protein